MTTIPELPSATAAAAADLLPISQGGITRAASVAQVTAGLQPTIALAAGQLVGRISSGTGGVETIAVGTNLSMANGTLSATAAPFVVAGLPTGSAPANTDLVAMGQSGINTSVPYAQFLGGLSNQTGLDLSHLSVTPTGIGIARHLGDQMADALPIEAFGAVGDGATDDTAAFVSALSYGRPIRLGSKTYIVNGQFTISTANATIIGVPGQSTIRRLHQTSGSAWITVQASGFHADGVMFDANKAAISTDNWGILLSSACTSSDFHRCVIANAGGPTLGHGLTIQASDPIITQHVLRDCEFYGNTLNGVWVQAVDGAIIQSCRSHDNGQYGIVLDFNDPTFVQKTRLSQVVGNSVWNNQRGIVVGNYNSTNTTPPVWGNANPDALNTLVVGNVAHDNTNYGIAVSGSGLLIEGNLAANNATSSTTGAGILANISYSRVCGNMITGSAQFGIDCGGSLSAEISQNYVLGGTIGINCGGGTSVKVESNTIQGAASWAIQANNVETDATGLNFGQYCSGLAIVGNWIAMSSGSAGGVILRDGPQQVMLARNHFIGSGGAWIGNAFWPNTDQVIIEENRWNFTQRFFANPTTYNGLQTVLLPDIADSIMISTAPSGVQSMLTNYQVATSGQITFVRVNTGGSNYTTATVAIAGSGTGATAQAVISQGVIIGIVVTSPGSGYGVAGATVPVTITGTGTGATATAYASVPIPEERRMRVRCNVAVKFNRSGSNPVQENWTATDITVAANADVEWIGTFNTWRAAFFSSGDYVLPDSLGGASLRSNNNADVQLHAGGTGHLRIVSDVEATGAMELIGRNSPQGAVTAPPGSTFRNLNGGVGSSFYVKQTGTGNTGWAAIG
jgi:hypothetical protein